MHTKLKDELESIDEIEFRAYRKSRFLKTICLILFLIIIFWFLPVKHDNLLSNQIQTISKKHEENFTRSETVEHLKETNSSFYQKLTRIKRSDSRMSRNLYYRQGNYKKKYNKYNKKSEYYPMNPKMYKVYKKKPLYKKYDNNNPLRKYYYENKNSYYIPFKHDFFQLSNKENFKYIEPYLMLNENLIKERLKDSFPDTKHIFIDHFYPLATTNKHTAATTRTTKTTTTSRKPVKIQTYKKTKLAKMYTTLKPTRRTKKRKQPFKVPVKYVYKIPALKNILKPTTRPSLTTKANLKLAYATTQKMLNSTHKISINKTTNYLTNAIKLKANGLVLEHIRGEDFINTSTAITTTTSKTTLITNSTSSIINNALRAITTSASKTYPDTICIFKNDIASTTTSKATLLTTNNGTITAVNSNDKH